MSTTSSLSTSTTPDRQSLRVLVGDEKPEALERLADTVRSLGHDVVECALEVEEAIDAVSREDPDASLIVLHSDPDHALALITETVQLGSGPVILLLEDEDPTFVQRAAEMGIDAYACGPTGDAVSSALSVAIARHRERSHLGDQVERLEGALQRRGAIERAKGILMERHALEERAAFEILRSTARGTNRRVVDVALAVQDGEALTPADG